MIRASTGSRIGAALAAVVLASQGCGDARDARVESAPEGNPLLLRAERLPSLEPEGHWILEVDLERRCRLVVDGQEARFELSESQLADLHSLLDRELFFELPSEPKYAMFDTSERTVEVSVDGRSKVVRTKGAWEREGESERFEAVWDLVTGWIEPRLTTGDPTR